MALLESNAAKIRWSTKVQVEGAVMGNERFHLAMAQATEQDVLQLTNPAAPLAITDDTVGKILFFAENDVPFNITPGPVGGATGPATIAGLLISNNAAFLAAMTLAELHRPRGSCRQCQRALQLGPCGVCLLAKTSNSFRCGVPPGVPPLGATDLDYGLRQLYGIEDDRHPGGTGDDDGGGFQHPQRTQHAFVPRRPYPAKSAASSQAGLGR